MLGTRTKRSSSSHDYSVHRIERSGADQASLLLFCVTSAGTPVGGSEAKASQFSAGGPTAKEEERKAR